MRTADGAKGGGAAREPEEFSLERMIERIELLLRGSYPFSRRAVALLVLQEDKEMETMVAERDPVAVAEIARLAAAAQALSADPLEYVVATRRQREAQAILAGVISGAKRNRQSWTDLLDKMVMNPLTGLPILLFVLYWGLYKFVGGFGAGTLVDLLESKVFDGWLSPIVASAVASVSPWQSLTTLIVGEYGIFTLGVRYSFGIILPIVGMFFLVFALIEDSGYLPRMALLMDKLFKYVGLSGRAVIPMVLGLGCATMATMVTRTLPTKRERLMATLLLALAVPCSAQLGVLLALLAERPRALLVWAGVIGLMFIVVGVLGARLLPGETPSFYMEVPPLRLPQLSNVLSKTWMRMVWYLKEVLPLFIAASVIVWFLDLVGAFSFCVELMRWPVSTAGLPPEAAKVFLFGFFRRDYGAAGLYDLDHSGVLNGEQLVVACVALTLFLPCVAQFLINIKERGMTAGLAISAFVLALAWGVAVVLHHILEATRMIL